MQRHATHIPKTTLKEQDKEVSKAQPLQQVAPGQGCSSASSSLALLRGSSQPQGARVGAPQAVPVPHVPWSSKRKEGLAVQPSRRASCCSLSPPVKPEAVYLVLGFCSSAHTLASERVYQQFHPHLFPALLNPIVMSIAPKMWSLFQKDQYNLLPGLCVSYFTRKQMTVTKRKDLVICQYF